MRALLTVLVWSCDETEDYQCSEQCVPREQTAVEDMHDDVAEDAARTAPPPHSAPYTRSPALGGKNQANGASVSRRKKHRECRRKIATPLSVTRETLWSSTAGGAMHVHQIAAAEVLLEEDSKHGAGSLTQFTHVQSCRKKEGPVHGALGANMPSYCHPFPSESESQIPNLVDLHTCTVQSKRKRTETFFLTVLN